MFFVYVKDAVDPSRVHPQLWSEDWMEIKSHEVLQKILLSKEEYLWPMWKLTEKYPYTGS